MLMRYPVHTPVDTSMYGLPLSLLSYAEPFFCLFVFPLLPESLTSERLCQRTEVSEDIHIHHWFT